jgi:hypothetical protein
LAGLPSNALVVRERLEADKFVLLVAVDRVLAVEGACLDDLVIERTLSAGKTSSSTIGAALAAEDLAEGLVVGRFSLNTTVVASLAADALMLAAARLARRGR